MQDELLREQGTVIQAKKKSDNEIIRVRTVFPIKLFPSDIIVDELKVTIIRRWFLYKNYFPILLKDIKTVTISHGVFFANITFEISGYETNPETVDYFWISEAMRTHKVIIGLIAVVNERSVEPTSSMANSNLLDNLESIGGTMSESR